MTMYSHHNNDRHLVNEIPRLVEVDPPCPSEHIYMSGKSTFFGQVTGTEVMDLSFSCNSQKFELELNEMLRKHKSDIEGLFYRFGTASDMWVPQEVSSMPSAQATGPCSSLSESKALPPEVSKSASAIPSKLSQASIMSYPEVVDTNSEPSTLSNSSPAFLGKKQIKNSVEYVPSWRSKRKNRWEMFQIRVWNFLEQPEGGLSNQIFHSIHFFLIVVSVASPVLATVKLSQEANAILKHVDTFFTILFTIELLTKLICYPDRLAFVKSLYTLIDFAVVFAGILGIALANVESIWLDLISTQVPILRLLKITRHSSGWRLLLMSMQNCAQPLLVPLYLMMLMIVFTGSLHFWIDNVLACTSIDCGKDERPAFTSIPNAMWFVLVSLSTVGYGDITPHTGLGKLLACFQIVAGLCYMAMPLAIIGNNFVEVWNDRHRILMRDKLANGVIKRDIKDVKNLFLSFDQDSSGTIALNEFLPFVESLEMGLSKRAIHHLFRSIDLDGSGIISFTEFVDVVFPDAQDFEINHN